MEDLNIMDIASQELTEDQVDNIQKLANSEYRKQDIEDIVGATSNYNTYFRKHRPIVRDHVKIGRNSLCPCGSGKKYKNCCLKSGEYETTHVE